MSLQTRKLTYQEYLASPEIKARYDIIDGEMVMAPSPTSNHQWILGELFASLRDHVMRNNLGRVAFAPLDVIVQQEPLRVRQPDLMFVRDDNRDIIREQVHGAPDLVVEILSPSNRRSDIESKLADYAALGVGESWLLSPQAETVEVLSLVDGSWIRRNIHGHGDRIESQVFPGFELPVSEIFAEP